MGEKERGRHDSLEVPCGGRIYTWITKHKKSEKGFRR
jgi:hypothetical protein